MADLLPSMLALLGGVVLLLVGGDVLVRGAVRLAARIGVAPLVVGMTVVAFGTSAPELAFNVTAALKGSSDLSFGNVVGSNIANVGLILGLTALFRPLLVHTSVVKRELPMMVAISLVCCGLALYPWPAGGLMGDGPGIGRTDAAVLLVCFVAFLAMTIRASLKPDGEEAGFVSEVKDLAAQTAEKPSLWTPVAFVLGGLAGLIVGGQLAEFGATGIATALGWSEKFIGLTVVAIATSLPELATSLAAVRRGHVDIAVGNVVGSNIFNLALVFGVTAMVSPIALPEAGLTALVVMLGLSLLLVPFSRTTGRRLSRAEGGFLLAIYLGYMGYEVWRVLGG